MKYFKLILSVDKSTADQDLIDAIYDKPNFDIEDDLNIEEVKDFIINNIIDQELGIDVMTMTEITLQELDAELDSLLPKQTVN